MGTVGDKSSIKSSKLVEVLATGELDAPVSQPMGQNGDELLLVDGLAAADHASQIIYFLTDTYEVLTSEDGVPNKLSKFDVSKAAWVGSVEIERPADTQWNAILATGDKISPLLLVGQRKVNDSDFYAYTLHSLDPETGKTVKLAESNPEQTFVNFLWAVVDYGRQSVFILGGRPNSAHFTF